MTQRGPAVSVRSHRGPSLMRVVAGWATSEQKRGLVRCLHKLGGHVGSTLRVSGVPLQPGCLHWGWGPSRGCMGGKGCVTLRMLLLWRVGARGCGARGGLDRRGSGHCLSLMSSGWRASWGP